MFSPNMTTLDSQQLVAHFVSRESADVQTVLKAREGALASLQGSPSEADKAETERYLFFAMKAGLSSDVAPHSFTGPSRPPLPPSRFSEDTVDVGSGSAGTTTDTVHSRWTVDTTPLSHTVPQFFNAAALQASSSIDDEESSYSLSSGAPSMLLGDSTTTEMPIPRGPASMISRSSSWCDFSRRDDSSDSESGSIGTCGHHEDEEDDEQEQGSMFYHYEPRPGRQLFVDSMEPPTAATTPEEDMSDDEFSWSPKISSPASAHCEAMCSTPVIDDDISEKTPTMPVPPFCSFLPLPTSPSRIPLSYSFIPKLAVPHSTSVDSQGSRSIDEFYFHSTSTRSNSTVASTQPLHPAAEDRTRAASTPAGMSNNVKPITKGGQSCKYVFQWKLAKWPSRNLKA